MSTLTGILEWPSRAEGRVRQLNGMTVQHADTDPFVPLELGERYHLRNGLEVTVEVGDRKSRRRRRGPNPGPRNVRPVVEEFLSIEGLPPDRFLQVKPFDELTSIDPQPRLQLEYRGCPPSCRLIDLFCPIGRGQRALIVSPPKAGKTTLLMDIAKALSINHPAAGVGVPGTPGYVPGVEVLALLIDERPEEVTDFRRNVPAQVFASSNDHDTEKHIALAQWVVERAKRMTEAGKHVVVLLDSITRMGRAFNASRRHASSGRTMTGGLDSKALEIPKQLFGAARNTEEAGSLTILATCLVDTGSAADQIIFEEFKGTGNMELILDRKIAERRLFPAINLAASGTRKEHLLMPKAELDTVTALRRRLLNTPPPVQIEQLLGAMQRFPTNAHLVGSAS